MNKSKDALKEKLQREKLKSAGKYYLVELFIILSLVYRIMDSSNNAEKVRNQHMMTNDKSTLAEECMEPDEVAKLVQYCKEHISESAYGVRLVSTLALRVGELSVIRWSDISKDGRYIHIHEQVTREEAEDGSVKKWVISDSTKNERREPQGGRYVKLLPDTLEALVLSGRLTASDSFRL